MGKQRIKPNYRRRLLRLPDLDHCKRAVLNSLGSPASRRVYEYAIDQFIAWYCSEPRLVFNRIVVVRYRMHLESRGLAANTSGAFRSLRLRRPPGRYFLCGWLANGIYIGSRMLRWPLSKNLHRGIRVRKNGSSVSEGHLR